MSAYDELNDEGEKLAADHQDQVENAGDAAIQRGGDEADRVTRGRHVKQVDELQDQAEDAVGG